MSRRATVATMAVLLLVAVVSVTLWRAPRPPQPDSPAAAASPSASIAATIASPSTSPVRSLEVAGGAWHMALDAPRARLYVAGPDALTVIDARTDSILSTISLPHRDIGSRPGGDVAVDSRTGRVFVTDFIEDQVFVIDSVEDRIIATIGVGRGPIAIVADVTGRVYVANLGQQSARGQAQPGSISTIDAATNRVLATLPLAGHPVDIAIHPARQRLYVGQLDVASGPSTVTVIDLAQGQTIATISMPPPVAIAVDETLDVVYVLRAVTQDQRSGPSALGTIDPANELHELELFPPTSAFAVGASMGSESRFYVAERPTSGRDGVLDIFEHIGTTADRFVRVAAVPIPGLASAIVANPQMRIVYVASRIGARVTVLTDPEHR